MKTTDFWTMQKGGQSSEAEKIKKVRKKSERGLREEESKRNPHKLSLS